MPYGHPQRDCECRQNGYEYRHVGWAVWMKSIVCMSKFEEDLCKAAKEAALVCAHDALPVTEVCVESRRRLRDFLVTELS